MIRKSPISGSWYKGTKEQLIDQMEELFSDEEFGIGVLPSEISTANDGSLLGVIVPHAGYVYSGRTATHSYANLKKYFPTLDTVIIIGPNHRAIGPPISIYPNGSWETPLGKADIEVNFIELLKATYPSKLKQHVLFEYTAHTQEHSIEIQVPFIQYLYNNECQIVPICLADQDLHRTSKPLSKWLHQTILEYRNKYPKRQIAVVASTDFSHEHSREYVETQDQAMRTTIQRRDLNEIENLRTKKRVTMCGFGAVYTLLSLASHFNQDYSLKELSYTNSGRITGRSDGYTVGYYAGAVFL